MHEQRMKDGDVRMDTMELRVVRALETTPEVKIADGFAARVVSQLPARMTVAETTPRYGLIAMQISMAALVLALVVLGMRSVDRTALRVALEWILCAQLIGVAMWLGGVRNLRLLDLLRSDPSSES